MQSKYPVAKARFGHLGKFCPNLVEKSILGLIEKNIEWMNEFNNSIFNSFTEKSKSTDGYIGFMQWLRLF